jgi:cell division protein FtsI (penicillin-binding protein 3)
MINIVRVRLHASLVFFVCGLLYLVILLRLFVVQIKQHNFYHSYADKQYHVSVAQALSRGPIFDCNGQSLAINKNRFSAFIFPQKIKNYEKLMIFLLRYFPEAAQRVELLKDKKFLYIVRKLSDKEKKLIESSGISDIHLLKEPCRFYTAPCLGSIVGITGIDNNGLFGIEKQYEELLAGKRCQLTLQQDARRGHFYFDDHKEDGVSCNNNTVALTIDSTLQFLVFQELVAAIEKTNAEKAHAVVMNPQTGQVLVMAQTLYFDPNKTKKLSLFVTKPECITEQYEFGSVMKIVTALAALAQDVVTCDEVIDCRNTQTTKIDGRTVNTWKSHGKLSFTDVVTKSNNIGLVQVSKRLGYDLYDHYLQCGFGQKTGINLTGEVAGFVNHPATWSKHSIISLSYGYEVAATMIQLARFFSMIANGGYAVVPFLVQDDKEQQKGEQLYDKVVIEKIKDILQRTVESGTAWRTRIDGIRVMAKTGTANILVDGSYSKDHNRFTCAGIIEKDDYQRVIVVHVQDAQQKNAFASTIAVPLFKEISQKLLVHDRVIS